MSLTNNANELIWGNDFLDPDCGTEHFLVVGATGSGKTTLIQMLMKSVLTGPLAATRRALVYDPKQDVVSKLSHPDLKLEVADRLCILHPFDQRCYAWDMAADIDGPLSARQIATILVPEDANSTGDSFFTNAVRDLLAGVFLAFINCVPNREQWTFRDVILTMLYEPYLRFILSLKPRPDAPPLPMLDRLRETYLTASADDSQGADPRTAANIRATINTKLSIYEPVAATWFKAWQGNAFTAAQNNAQGGTLPRRLSLKQWIHSNEVLVMGNDEASRAALDAINQAMFRRITELTLSQPELSDDDQANGAKQTWFFLDEVREAGELEGLSRLMNKGRSKGACIVLGFQDIDGLRAVYGEEIAHEITGQCANIAILKLNSPSTAAWAVETQGKVLAMIATDSWQGGTTGSNLGKGETPLETTSIRTRDLLTLPLTSKENGLTGYFKDSEDTLNSQVLRTHLDWQRDIQNALLPKSKDAENFEERPPVEHYLLPWDQNDWQRLGFPGPLPGWSTAPAGGASNDKKKGPPPNSARLPNSAPDLGLEFL